MSSYVLKIKYNDDMRRISFERIPQFDELVKAVIQLFQLSSAPLIKYEDDEKDLVTITSDVELREAFSVAKNIPLRISVIAANSKSRTSPSYKTPEPAPKPTNFAPHPFFESLSKMLQGIMDEKSVEDITQKLQSFSVNPEQNYPELLQLLQGLGISGVSGDIQDLLRGIYSNNTNYFSVPRHDGGNNNNNNNNNANYGAMPRNHDVNNGDNVQTHVGVTCDGCQQHPLQGTRYQCTLCVNYDLCEKCEAKGAAVHDPNHPMVKIPVPLRHHAFAGGRGCPYRRNKQDLPRAQYVADVSIPDHTVLAPNTKFVKIWCLRNVGEVPWPAGAQLRFAGGDRLGADAIVEVPIQSLAPGQEVNLAVEMVAPSHPGRYTSFWRLTDSFGNPFGQKLWADIFVEPAAPSSPAQNGPAAAAPVAVPVEPIPATPSELELVKKLEDMGFQGDLLAVVRKNRGDLLACIRQCLGM